MHFEEIKQKIDSIRSNSQYFRVSATHPLELYIGKNEKGFLTLRFNGDFTPVKVLGTAVIEIKQVKAKEYNSILFSLVSNDNTSLFYHFCEDIITQTEAYEGQDGYTEIVNRFSQWKKMFSGDSKILSESEVLGLIGELLFLQRHSFSIYGITKGLNGWSGPEPTHKDFSYEHEWFEIKSINTHKSSVSISSLEQLDSDIDGHLIIYTFEKMSPSFSGITLNSLVADIAKMLQYETDRDIFLSKLKQAGYSYNDIYDNYVYNFIKVNSYLVDREFPRIKASDLPKGIVKVEYEILLSWIEKNKED
ncbi:MAG: PD-(D/E)XK motif protein [Erysipelotrichales bacterium]|nr:PD-(D/E)XK motif protein [Erysipelotrichales bacterium]